MLRRTVTRYPDLAAARTNLVSQLLSLRREREAVAELKIAQRLDPRDKLTARMQVLAYERLGEPDAAADACERGIRLGSTDGWERSHLGWIRIQQGRLADGVDLMKEALRREPGNVDYLYGLGFAHLLRDELGAAAQELEKVLSLRGDYGPARLHAARARWLQGEPRRALALLEAPGSVAGLAPADLRALADSIRAGMRRGR
jgi:tetratricopeptide (TPR) repeat protein